MITAISLLLWSQATSEPLFEGLSRNESYRMVIDIEVEDRVFDVVLSPTESRSSARRSHGLKRPLALGKASYLPAGGFQPHEGSDDYTLGMDFLADKVIGVDLRDRTVCIWPANSAGNAKKWLEKRIDDTGSTIDVVLGKPGPQGVSLDLKSDRGQATAVVSLGFYGSTLPEALKTGLEARPKTRPGVLSHFIEVGNRKVFWPWFLTDTRPQDKPATNPNLFSLANLKSRYVTVNFANGEIHCEGFSQEKQIAFFLQEAIGIPFQVKRDEIVLGSKRQSENRLIESVVGFKVKSINGLETEQVLEILRNTKPQNTLEASRCLFESNESTLEIEDQDGEIIEMTLKSGGLIPASKSYPESKVRTATRG